MYVYNWIKYLYKVAIIFLLVLLWLEMIQNFFQFIKVHMIDLKILYFWVCCEDIINDNLMKIWIYVYKIKLISTFKPNYNDF